MIYKPTMNTNPITSEIMMRFKSAHKSGILLYARGETERDGHLMLELHSNSLILISKLYGEILEISNFEVETFVEKNLFLHDPFHNISLCSTKFLRFFHPRKSKTKCPKFKDSKDSKIKM